jgi:hypothetical protein
VTLAICLRCGYPKVGAWTICQRCHFQPQTKDDLAKSVLLSDHYRDADSLENITKLIESGGSVPFDQNDIEVLKSTIEANPYLLKAPLGCHIVVWALVGVMLILVVMVIVMFFIV